MSTVNTNQMNMIQILVSGFLNGVYTMIFGASMYALIFRQGASPQRCTLLLVNISLYVLCAVQAAITFWQSFVSTDELANGSSGGDPTLVHEVLLYDLGQNIIDALIPCTNLIADGLLVWRCYVLYNRRAWVMVVPVVLLAAGTACGFAVVAFDCKLYRIRLHAPPSSAVPPPQWSTLTSLSQAIRAAMYIISAVTNSSMSGLIAFRIWKATRNIGKNKVRYLRVASLLLETGIVYSVTLILDAIFAALDPTRTEGIDNLVGTIVMQITQQLVGIFPAVIILMVALGKTSDQTVIYSDSQKKNRAQKTEVSSILFASPPARARVSGATGPTHSIELETRGIVLDVVENAVDAEEL
ncbi:hypothetical protein OE88DRAFT_1732648 [Heliocybe sulcata]|uniref:Uncharacterized protein n=1 Tax=Heliocybe sulcata TaxID=5364 RepID=A0A5C3ND42_9AGAM|nr:hypothetical protein OE88DRAFT_1732648 [Heliocybe sulcata]